MYCIYVLGFGYTIKYMQEQSVMLIDEDQINYLCKYQWFWMPNIQVQDSRRCKKKII